MSRTPTTRDPYEQQTVYVGQSRIHPEAGEGLFAKRPLPTGALVALFNGVRQREITGMVREIYGNFQIFVVSFFGKFKLSKFTLLLISRKIH